MRYIFDTKSGYTKGILDKFQKMTRNKAPGVFNFNLGPKDFLTFLNTSKRFSAKIMAGKLLS